MSFEAPKNGGALARAFALLTVLFVAWSVYALGTNSLPPLAADRGRIDSAISLNLVVSGIVFLGAHVALVMALLRRPKEARIPHENLRVEILWTSLTAIVLVALLVNSEIDSRALAAASTKAEAEPPVVV